MDIGIWVSPLTGDRRVIGDIVRFNAKRHGEPILIDMGLMQWTVLRDRNPDINVALHALASLAVDGEWLMADGQCTLFVSLPPLATIGDQLP